MNLTPGQRLIGGERSAYDVLGPAFEVPEYHFYRARKVFWNLRPTDPILYEADPDESLGVLLRVLAVTAPCDLQFELERVLSIPEAPGLPLPVDLLDTPDGPILVLTDCGGEPLPAGSVTDPGTLGRRARILREILELLAAFHGRDLVTGGLALGDFREDPSGPWWFLRTDRVMASWTPAMLADEVGDWRSLAFDLLFGQLAERSPGPSRPELDGDGAAGPRVRVGGRIPGPSRPDLAGPEVAALEQSLAGRDLADFRWVISRMNRCVGGPPAARPTSAFDLIRGPIAAPGPVGSLWSTLDSLRQRLRGGGP